MERKKEALDAIELMSEALARKIQVEQSRNGLVIESAIYGKLPRQRQSVSVQSRIHEILLPSESEPSIDPELGLPFCDATSALQMMVVESRLTIAGGYSKSSLLGFYDPCFGEDKFLRVRYTFKGKAHEVEIEDDAAFSIPLRTHLVRN